MLADLSSSGTLTATLTVPSGGSIGGTASGVVAASLLSSGNLSGTVHATTAITPSASSWGTLSATLTCPSPSSASLASSGTLSATLGLLESDGFVVAPASEGSLSGTLGAPAAIGANLASEGQASGYLNAYWFPAASSGTLSATLSAGTSLATAPTSSGTLTATLTVPGSGPADPLSALASSGTLSATLSCTAPISAHLRSSSTLVFRPLAYHVYANDGLNGPVDYGSPIFATSGLSYLTMPLAAPSDTTFAVRAFWVSSGLEEKNVDARFRIIIDASGNDASAIPASPTLLGAFALSGGRCRVDWAYLPGARSPAASFRCYLTAGTAIDYSASALAVAFVRGQSAYHATLSGLADGVAYVVAVRAFNGTGHDEGTASLPVVGSSAPPSNVDGLQAFVVHSG